MDLRITWQAVLALVVTIGGGAWGVWWIFVREPKAPKQSVSAAWLDEQLRGRRN